MQQTQHGLLAQRTDKYKIMIDKCRLLKNSPSLIACRLATETWPTDSRCVS